MKNILGLTAFVLIPWNEAPTTSCLSKFYYGTYGGVKAYLPPDWCALETQDQHIPGFQLKIYDNTTHLAWIGRNDINCLWESHTSRLERCPPLYNKINLEAAEQLRLSTNITMPSIILPTPFLAFLGISDDTILPFLDYIFLDSFSPVLLPQQPITDIPIPDNVIAHLKDLLANLVYDANIAFILDEISLLQMTDDIHYLTGEAKDSPIISRHSYHTDTRLAAAWLSDTIERSGAECKLQHFMLGFAPNVICEYQATIETNATIILGAHYDSRGSFGDLRAPGANDDGSGTVSVLSIARTIGRLGIKFKTNVQLVLFAGEEQGLVGSRHYAHQLKLQNKNVTLMIQADMLAYHESDKPPQLSLPQLVGTPELTRLVANASLIYSPELELGYIPGYGSDHQSFHEQGFPATQVNEGTNEGNVIDPKYHNSADISQRPNYDLKQVKSITKATFAVLLHAAGFESNFFSELTIVAQYGGQ